MLELPLTYLLTDRLRSATHRYIRECLSLNLKEECAETFGPEELAKRYGEELKLLPNLTPNGLVMCKEEVVDSYNSILVAAANIIKYLGLNNTCDSIHCPVNIRLRWGIPDQYILERPRASTKWHSDLWAGESSDNVTIHIPIFGNFVDNGMSLMKTADEFFPNYIRPLPSFDEAAELVNNPQEYDIDMQIGNAYLVDSFLLHRTRYGHPSFRAILSFHLRPYIELESSLYKGEEAREENYMSSDQWVQLGQEYFVFTDKKFEAYTEEDVTQNRYADTYEVISKAKYENIRKA